MVDEARQEPVSILAEDGSCAAEHRALVPDADLLAILDLMIFNRVFDRRMLLLQRQGRLGFSMTSTGEEAAIIGSAYCLDRRDPIFLQYRELGAILWRGVPLNLIVHQLIGNSQDLCKGRQMPIHYCFVDWDIPSVSSPTGTQLPHACGFAFAAKQRGTGQVSLAFLGEGTASQGDFHTSLNFAGVFRLPVVFVIRNNGYAISTPEVLQTAARSLAARGPGYGIPGVQVDGNDLLAVVSVVGEAVRRAREGGGATLIEALTYRLGAHSSADDPTVYRSAAEAESWTRVDALLRLQMHASWRGIWSEDREAQVRDAAEKRIDQLIEECERWPPPPVESLFDDVFEGVPEHLEEQKEAYLKFYRGKSASGFLPLEPPPQD